MPDITTIDFVEKYRPKSVADVMGNKRQITQIESWLKNYEKNRITSVTSQKKNKKRPKIDIKIDDIVNDSGFDVTTESEFDNKISTGGFKKGENTEHACLMLVGSHGVGKTCTVKAVLKQLNYVAQTFDLSLLGSNKSIPEHVNKLTKGTNIFDKINGNNNIKTAILIDEIESANSPVEKNFILTLMKTNEEYWYLPVIFISNGKHTKLNSVLKTYSNNVTFNQPVRDELMLLLSNIATKEHMCFDSLNVGYELVAHAQNDYRRLVSIIQDLKIMYGKKSISQEIMLDYQNLSKKKDTTVEIFKSSAQMMVKYKSINECLKIYEKEKVIIPLVIHQNFIKTIINSRCDQSKKFGIVNDIAKSIAFGDLVENYIYSDQNWDMQEVHGFLTCVAPTFRISSEKINMDEHFLKNSLEFPYDLNRTSIKKINKRNIINSNTCLKNFEIKDFIFANRLIRQLLDEEKVDECAALFKGYGAFVENIESILKIDKINEPKTILNTNVRKRLVQLMGSKKSTAQAKEKKAANKEANKDNDEKSKTKPTKKGPVESVNKSAGKVTQTTSTQKTKKTKK